MARQKWKKPFLSILAGQSEFKITIHVKTETDLIISFPFFSRRAVYNEHSILLEDVGDNTGKLFTFVCLEVVEEEVCTTQLL